MGKIIKYCKGKQNVSSLRRKNPREKTVGQEGISMDKDWKDPNGFQITCRVTGTISRGFIKLTIPTFLYRSDWLTFNKNAQNSNCFALGRPLESQRDSFNVEGACNESCIDYISSDRLSSRFWSQRLTQTAGTSETLTPALVGSA